MREIPYAVSAIPATNFLLTDVSLIKTKMSKCELKVARPADFQPALWEALNRRLMKVLTENFDIDANSDEACNWLFYEFLSARQIRDIAVMVFGNDLPYTLKVVTNLRLAGDGACPNCGSNDRADITGDVKNEETYGTYFEIIGYKCNSCLHKDYR